MALPETEIESRLKSAFEDAQITIEAMGGNGESYRVLVVSKAFEGKTRVAQHRLVYDALGGAMDSDLHALALETKAA